jgi:signal transduction histidine kinase
MIEMAGRMNNGVQNQPNSPAAGHVVAVEGEAIEGPGPRYPGPSALFLIWTAVGVLTSARHFFGPPSRNDDLEWPLFVACIVYLYPWIALSPVAFRLERRFPLATTRWARHLTLLAMASVPICLAAAPVMFAVAWLVFAAFGAPSWRPRNPSVLFGYFPVAQAMFWASVGGGYVIRTRSELREQERRAARLALEKSQLEAGLNQAQLEALRAKLNPHFLFNSLQNISVMTREDPQVASRMLVRLGDVLRAVLRQDARPETTLREEVELTRSYVELEQMRFGDRLRVVFRIDGDASLALVPCFLLQPLIENAVIHGLRGAQKQGVITVSAVAEANVLVLTVTDNGVGLPQQGDGGIKLGVGLGSTCERLAKMYAGRHTFSMSRRPDGGTEVRITMPLRRAAGEHLVEHVEQPAAAVR